MDEPIVISVITEIELLGWREATDQEIEYLHLLLDDCIIFDLTVEIRRLAIQLRQQFKIKTPDAIIPATSKYLQIPLITSDRHFMNIPGIELILLQ